MKFVKAWETKIVAEPGAAERVDELETELRKASYMVKDSGEREQYGSGMVRDTAENKARFDLLVPKEIPYEAQFLTRVAIHLMRGAKKYSPRNWELGNGTEEMERAKESAFRHLIQWLTGETDEDHAAAVVFNLMVVETIKWKLKN